MATNLALQLQVIEPDTDLNSIMIGNSRYSDDVWDLRPFITAKSTKESHKYIRFEYITNAEMKKTYMIFILIFIFPIIAGLQCSVNFLLYSKVTQSDIHVYIPFSIISMLHRK